MFRKLLFLLLFIFMSSQANAIELMKEKTTTGAGSTIKVEHLNAKTWACDIIHTGSPTAITVRIEGNQGGTTFDPIGMTSHTCTAAQLVAGICAFGFDAMPAINIRANIITLTGGSSPTVTVQCTGVR